MISCSLYRDVTPEALFFVCILQESSYPVFYKRNIVICIVFYKRKIWLNQPMVFVLVSVWTTRSYTRRNRYNFSLLVSRLDDQRNSIRTRTVRFCIRLTSNMTIRSPRNFATLQQQLEGAKAANAVLEHSTKMEQTRRELEGLRA